MRATNSPISGCEHESPSSTRLYVSFHSRSCAFSHVDEFSFSVTVRTINRFISPASHMWWWTAINSKHSWNESVAYPSVFSVFKRVLLLLGQLRTNWHELNGRKTEFFKRIVTCLWCASKLLYVKACWCCQYWTLGIVNVGRHRWG